MRGCIQYRQSLEGTDSSRTNKEYDNKRIKNEKTVITKDDVVEAENKLFSAQRVSNVDILGQLLHDDLVGVAPTGQIITKEMDLNAHRGDNGYRRGFN